MTYKNELLPTKIMLILTKLNHIYFHTVYHKTKTNGFAVRKSFAFELNSNNLCFCILNN